MRRLLAAIILTVTIFPAIGVNTSIVVGDEPLPGDIRPNVMVLMLDDHAFIDHRIWDRLPNISSLFLNQGIEALNYWGEDPLCCPGRANFLTGQQAHVNGVTHNDARLLDSRETIATELQSQGYYTNICGKYLNRTEKLADKSPLGWNNAAIMSGGYYRYTAFVNDREEHHGATPEDYSTDVFADYCMGFMENAPADKPLFFFMTPYATHGGPDANGHKDRYEGVPAPRYLADSRCDGIAPWDPPNYNLQKMSDKPAYMRRRPLLPSTFSAGYPLEKRCRTLLAVDDWVGRLVDELKQTGRYDNTIFILTVDNGMGWGSFRWERKIAPHTAQLPLFINWPAVTGITPTQTDTLLTNVDLAPTICELAGCTMGPYPNGQPVNGQSFAGLIAPLLSSSLPVRDSIILEQRGNSVTPIWRAIMTDPDQDSTGKQYYYIWNKNDRSELYDLTADPYMLKNLSYKRAYSSIKKGLAQRLASDW